MGRDGRTARRDGETPHRRADAARNIDAILDAAARCFSANSNVSMTEIAQAAGVGRVTLYAHFPSREVLLGELMERNVANATTALDSADLDHGPADQALSRLLRNSWQLLDRQHSLVGALLRHLPGDEVRKHHDPILRRIENLIARGRSEGTVRTDLPLHWLVTTVFTLTHAAVQQLDDGHLDSETALAALEATLGSALKADSP
jgi:TetR/AcrR family transcriptional regulator, mexCD-oprJ operon repressor